MKNVQNKISMINDIVVRPSHDTIKNVPPPCISPSLTGHDDIRKFLSHTYKSERLHHALLFYGQRGIGKAILAFHLAGHMLLHPDAKRAPRNLESPDFTKPIYRQIASGTHPSVLYIDRPFDQKLEKFKVGITIDDIRRITRFLTKTAHDGAWRIVIIDSADDMNHNAANALLKTLEEPRAFSLFVLISHTPGRLLPTIRSRCQPIHFKPLHETALQEALTAIGFKGAKEECMNKLIECAEGSVRKAALLIAYDGLDIVNTTDALLEKERFHLPTAYALAERLNGREAEIQYNLFCDILLQRIAKCVQIHASEGVLGQANAWACFWNSMCQNMLETKTFHLDRKQTVLILLEKVHKAFHQCRDPTSLSPLG